MDEMELGFEEFELILSICPSFREIECGRGCDSKLQNWERVLGRKTGV